MIFLAQARKKESVTIFFCRSVFKQSQITSKTCYEVQQGVIPPPSQTVLPFSTFAWVVFEIKRL